MCLCGRTYANVQLEHRLLHRPPWGPSRELRVRTAVKSQEQTSSSRCSPARLRMRFRPSARASAYPGVPPGPPAPLPAHCYYSPHLSPAQDFYQTAWSSPGSGGEGGSPWGSRCALYELPVCSFPCPFGSSPGGALLRGSCSDGRGEPSRPLRMGCARGLHPRAALRPPAATRTRVPLREMGARTAPPRRSGRAS